MATNRTPKSNKLGKIVGNIRESYIYKLEALKSVTKSQNQIQCRKSSQKHKKAKQNLSKVGNIELLKFFHFFQFNLCLQICLCLLGIWAVINTSGTSYRGRLEHQDVSHWDSTLKTNVIGVLRIARTFQGLLRHTGGRIVTLGCSEGGAEAGLVAYTAARYAVEGASNALRHELAPIGIKVVTLNLRGVAVEVMFAAPRLKK